jgi:ABC-type microcin C transport system permease subunit YejB
MLCRIYKLRSTAEQTPALVLFENRVLFGSALFFFFGGGNYFSVSNLESLRAEIFDKKSDLTSTFDSEFF